MTRLYLLAPLVALLLFAGAYTISQRGAAEREQALLARRKIERAQKLEAERAARQAAIDEALKAQAERNRLRAEREARETAAREARQAALEARETAARETERLAREIERLKRDVATEQEAVDRLQIDHDAALAEKAHLEKLLPKARANAADLQQLLTRLTTPPSPAPTKK